MSCHLSVGKCSKVGIVSKWYHIPPHSTQPKSSPIPKTSATQSKPEIAPRWQVTTKQRFITCMCHRDESHFRNSSFREWFITFCDSRHTTPFLLLAQSCSNSWVWREIRQGRWGGGPRRLGRQAISGGPNWESTTMFGFHSTVSTLAYAFPSSNFISSPFLVWLLLPLQHEVLRERKRVRQRDLRERETENLLSNHIISSFLGQGY